MIPDFLRPLFVAVKMAGYDICIAGGYAACPEKASDIDVWITAPFKNLDVRNILANTLAPEETWESLLFDQQARPLGEPMLAEAKIDLRHPESILPIQVMFTKHSPNELVNLFDTTCHAIAIGPGGIHKGAHWTPITERPMPNPKACDAGSYRGEMRDTTAERLKRFRKRYAQQSGWESFRDKVRLW